MLRCLLAELELTLRLSGHTAATSPDLETLQDPMI